MGEADAKALQVLVAGLAGGIFQWAFRAPKKIPTWVFFAGVGVATAGLYFWATPDVVAQFKANWRLGLMSAVSWFLMVRGGSSTAKDIKLAGPANST
jgi:hypothetical protein